MSSIMMKLAEKFEKKYAQKQALPQEALLQMLKELDAIYIKFESGVLSGGMPDHEDIKKWIGDLSKMSASAEEAQEIKNNISLAYGYLKSVVDELAKLGVK